MRMLRHVFGWVFGIPASDEHDATVENLAAGLDPIAAAERLRNAVQHNTEKAGALLAAQGILIVADTFALDHGWPKIPILVSLISVVVGAFLVMSILRSTMRMYRPRTGGGEPIRLIYHLLISRMIRFNSALYLTFLSILLLAIAAMSFV
jgi:hypothetical protein